MQSLEKEFKYYLSHQNELVEKYNDQYIVIKEEEVIGSYESEIEAIEKTQETYDLGTFLVHKCGAGKDNYTQTYHSRVIY